MIKFALVGTGNIARTYVNACRNVEGAEVACVVSRSKKKAAEFAAEHEIEYSCTSIKEAAALCQAIFAANPNGAHGPSVIEAAENGLHSLVEKPLEITDKKMQAMMNACKINNVKLGVTYQRRLHPANKSVKNLIDSGAFGKIYAVDLFLKFYRPQSYYDSAQWRGTVALDGGGPFMQQGSHDIDLLCWFFGLPKKVFARTGTFAHERIEVEDHGAAVLELSTGAICTVVASTSCAPGFDPRLEVSCEKGSFTMVNNRIISWQIDGVENPCPEIESETGAHSSATSVSVSDTSGHEAVITDFISAIRDDREPLINGPEGERASKAILAIYESAKTGRDIIL